MGKAEKSKVVHDGGNKLQPHCSKSDRAEVGFAALPMEREILHNPDHILVFIPMTEEEKAAYGGNVHTWAIKILLEKTGAVRMDKVRAQLDKIDSSCASVLADMGVERDLMIDTALAQLQLVAAFQKDKLTAMREALKRLKQTRYDRVHGEVQIIRSLSERLKVIKTALAF